jgi:hypothetical protein
MTHISYEAFRWLEAANPDGLNLAGLTVVVPWGTAAVITGKACNGIFEGAMPGEHPVYGTVPEPEPRDEATLAALRGFATGAPSTETTT